jgi:adenine-specific DNA-methyltransferase
LKKIKEDKKLSKIKKNGEVFTPELLVRKMLDQIGYYGPNILEKYIMENSFGQGAFLDEIITRYKFELTQKGFDDEDDINKELSKYVYGIELDPTNFNIVKNKYPFLENIYNEDTLFIEKDFPKFDTIVGNPPYVRVHNLKEDYKEKLKAKYDTAFGTFDLYYLFYEWAIKNININSGVIQYITPTGFTNNSSGIKLRELIDSLDIWFSFLDLSDINYFPGISTYTGIVTLKKKEVAPWKKDVEKFKINGKFQSGLATNCDPVFIKEKEFFNNDIKKEGLIKKSYKCSSREYGEIVWPYINSKLISEIDLEKQYPKTYSYLLLNKSILEDRSLKGSKWFEYARSQGIKDMLNKKLAISLLNPEGTINFEEVDSDTVVYQGVYFTGDIEEAKKLLKNKEFIKSVESFGTKRQNNYIQLTAGVFNKVLEE